MTIDEAIEILTVWKETSEYSSCSDLHKAEALSIEALKRVKEGRAKGYPYFGHLLPGEHSHE